MDTEGSTFGPGVAGDDRPTPHACWVMCNQDELDTTTASTTIHLGGDLAPSLNQALDAAAAVAAHRRMPIVVDVAAVTFFGELGVCFLGTLMRTAPGQVHVINVGDRTQQTLRRTGLLTLLGAGI